MDYVVITGGGSGIGRALAHRLAGRFRVLIAGRTLDRLEAARQDSPAPIEVCAADVSTPEGRDRIAEALPAAARVAHLVHNAAVLQPVGPLREVSLEDWRHHQAVNVEGPLFLTQRLLPRLGGGRVLHVSSGAAHRPVYGWGAYCTSKAALHMLYRCLQGELQELGIRVGSARPGVVDTPMQAQIRATSAEQFPDVDRFISLKETGQLFPPDEVARFLGWLLLETDDEPFSAEEWDIRDAWHHARWR